MSLEAFLKKIYRRLFPAKPAGPSPKFDSRDESQQRFEKTVAPLKDKLQIGVRGEKIGPEWIAVDLFDDSSLIDHNYDIQNLPFESESFDCVVCNAILEHVPWPELALYEFHRILRPGGHLWIEVPFIQAYHSHPYDYWRCTLPGIRRWCEDFDERAAGIFEGFAYEAGIMYSIWARDLGLPESDTESTIEQIKTHISANEERRGTSTKLYMATFYWGTKPSDRRVEDAKGAYMEHLKTKLSRD